MSTFKLKLTKKQKAAINKDLVDLPLAFKVKKGHVYGKFRKGGKWFKLYECVPF